MRNINELIIKYFGKVIVMGIIFGTLINYKIVEVYILGYILLMCKKKIKKIYYYSNIYIYIYYTNYIYTIIYYLYCS